MDKIELIKRHCLNMIDWYKDSNKSAAYGRCQAYGEIISMIDESDYTPDDILDLVRESNIPTSSIEPPKFERPPARVGGDGLSPQRKKYIARNRKN